MANGGKKKNKKSEESGRKEESLEEKRNREERDKKRAEIEAKVMKAKQELEQKVMMNQMGATTSREKDWPKKKEGDNEDGKRAADNKRRDSLGGSVSTSSNSSGTDCDEVLSEASKSAIASPQSETSGGSPAPSRIHIADAISSIHQVAHSVVEAGTVDALSSLGDYLHFTPQSTVMPGKSRKKAGARNLAATKATVAAPKENGEECSSPSTPLNPRQVVTPILTGGSTTPSAELAAFRSIADDHPAEIPGATPQTDAHEEVAEDGVNGGLSMVDLYQYPPGVLANLLESTHPTDIGRPIQPYKAAVKPEYPMRSPFSAENSDAFFRDLLQSQYVQSVTDPSKGENVYNSRPDYYLSGRIFKESVGEKPNAYKSLVRDCGQRHDMMAAHELNVRMEKDEGLWLKGERNVLKNIYDDVPKLLAKQKEPWIRELLEYIFDGRSKKVYNRMKVMVNVYRGKEEFQKKTDAEIYTHIATTLLDAGTNSDMGYSYVHVLASQGNGHKMCGENGHRKCMTLQEVLGPLSPESLQKALSLKTREWRNRTPVHYATATGQPCQLDTLQKFYADVTSPDELGTTPVLYAVVRDNLLMLRMLQWYGADLMQTCDKTGHAVLDYVNVTGKFPLGKSCKEFIQRRNDAFEKILKIWMAEITPSLVIKKGLSEVHTIDCRQPSDQVIEKIPINNEMVNVAHWIGHVNKTVHLKLRQNVLIEDRCSMFLLIMPFTYRISDEHQPADYPDVVRRTLFIDEDGEKLRPIPFFPEAPFLSVKDPLSSRPPLQKALVPLLMQANTGTFWAYKIPSDVFTHECLWVTMSLDLLKVDVALRNNLRLLIQIVSIKPTNK